MGKLQVTGGNGIQVQYDGLKIALDPLWKTDAGITFVSHAHLDHVSRNPSPRGIVASNETIKLLRSRGIDTHINGSLDDDRIRLYDSGHILGSRGILIENEIYYTGDIAGRPRAFLGKGQVPKARIMIVESTYGRPEFKFPPIEKIVKQTKEIIGDAQSQDSPVVLMGYPLGKSQILTSLFKEYEPLYLQGSVAKSNGTCVELGVDLPESTSYTEAKEKKLLERRDWLLIAPVYSGRTSFMKNLKRKYRAVSIAFTGWALHSSYKYAMAVDHALPLSDHCDFSELVQMVRRCDPEEIYVTHGFRSEFATHLTTLGYKATALNWRQRPLADFIGAE